MNVPAAAGLAQKYANKNLVLIIERLYQSHFSHVPYPCLKAGVCDPYLLRQLMQSPLLPFFVESLDFLVVLGCPYVLLLVLHPHIHIQEFRQHPIPHPQLLCQQLQWVVSHRISQQCRHLLLFRDCRLSSTSIPYHDASPPIVIAWCPRSS